MLYAKQEKLQGKIYSMHIHELNTHHVCVITPFIARYLWKIRYQFSYYFEVTNLIREEGRVKSKFFSLQCAMYFSTNLGGKILITEYIYEVDKFAKYNVMCIHASASRIAYCITLKVVRLLFSRGELGDEQKKIVIIWHRLNNYFVSHWHRYNSSIHFLHAQLWRWTNRICIGISTYKNKWKIIDIFELCSLF